MKDFDFKNMSVSDVQQLLNGRSPIMSAIVDASVDMFRKWMAAENMIIKLYCELHGIEVPVEGTDVEKRTKLSKMLVVTSQNYDPDFTSGETVLIKETWCCDRRDGKTGYEKTRPRIRLFGNGHKMEIKLVLTEEDEKT